MLKILQKRRLMLLCSAPCMALLVCLNLLAAPNANTTAETKVGQGQLFAILQVPSIQKELSLTDEQITKIARLEPIPYAVTFPEAIEPLKTLLTDEQLSKFKKIAIRSLMVRAFSVSEVQDSLELTPEQKTSIAAIQAKLMAQLQPFQDKLSRGEIDDPLALERDITPLYKEAFMKALDVLTMDQREKWEEIANPGPLRGQKDE